MTCRVVRPQEVTLALSDGDWLRVKKRLTAGEAREQFTRIIQLAPAGEKPLMNPMQVGLSRILVYLLDWSLTDEDGKPLPLHDAAGNLSPAVMIASLDAIDPESFDEIKTAIETHEAAMDAEREAEKKTPTPSRSSEAT